MGGDQGLLRPQWDLLAATEGANLGRELWVVRMSEVPKAINVHIMDVDAPPGGVGEPGVPPVAPAIVNAYFAATGKRLRRLPIRAEDLRTA